MAAKVWGAGSAAGADGLWSTPANWTSDTVPVTTDTVTFNNTASSPNCTVDNVGTFTGSITVASTYAGIITQNVAIPAGAAFSIAGGTWNQAAAFSRTTMAVTGGAWVGASQAMNLAGTLTFSGGSLTMTSGTCSISVGDFLQTNTPTFNANGGTIAFTGSTNQVLTGLNCAFNLIAVSKSNSDFTVSAGTTCPLGTNPTATALNDTFNVNGTLTWTGTLTVNWEGGTLSVGATGVLTASGTPAIVTTASLTFHASSTVTTGIPVTFNGNGNQTVTATAYTFGTCVVNKTNGDFTIAAGTTIPLGTNPTINMLNDPFTVNGTLTWTGTLTVNTTGLFSTGAAGAITVSGTPTLSVAASLTFHATSTITSGLQVTFVGTSDATVTATNHTLGICVINKTSANFTVAANTIVPLGASPTTSVGSLSTFTITGTVTATGTWAHTGAVILSSTGTITGTVNLVLTNASFTGTAGGIAGGTTVTITFTSGSGRTFAGAGITFAGLTRAGAGSGILTITGANTFGTFTDNAGSVAHTIIFPNVTTTVGTFNVTGSSGKLVTLTRTGASGTFTLTTTGGTVSCDYLSISNSTVDASPKWYAGANSTDGTGNTNWIFTAPPPIINRYSGGFVVAKKLSRLGFAVLVSGASSILGRRKAA